MSCPAGFSFSLEHRDSGCDARRGRFVTPHGSVDTPAFMPVGTLAAVKGILPEQLRRAGVRMLLANTYHLTLRPGESVVAELGGLHRFMDWSGPILTDSGGFQVFSLSRMTRVTDHGVTFRSHIDGRALELTPERAVEIQEALGSDVAMVLDHVVELPNTHGHITEAVERTLRWAERSRNAHRCPRQALFGIVQGGLDPELRIRCAERLVELDFCGYAVGGLSVGESADEMALTLEVTVPVLPEDRPRYLMGVGRPEDLLEAVSRGIDLFDCVMPTRNGRNAMAFTDVGPLRLRNRQFQRDPRPIDADCPCPACRYSRGYLRHLFMAGEMLGPILLSLHNLTYYQRLMAETRAAIEQSRYPEFHRLKRHGWRTPAEDRANRSHDANRLGEGSRGA